MHHFDGGRTPAPPRGRYEGPAAKPSRRAVMMAAPALPLAAVRRRPARAAEFTCKVATGQSLAQPVNARLDGATKRIREASGGRLKIRFFPASHIAGSVISAVAPGAAVTDVGFAFADNGQVWSAVDGPVGTCVRAQIEKAGVVVAAKASDDGFRQITSSEKPIRAEDAPRTSSTPRRAARAAARLP